MSERDNLKSRYHANRLAAEERRRAWEEAHPDRGEGWWWTPGFYRCDRGYSRDEARVAVGPGWEPIVDEAWSIIAAAGGATTQVKQKFFSLRVYWGGVQDPSVREEVEERINALEAASTRVCEWCGVGVPGGEFRPFATGRGVCDSCGGIPPYLHSGGRSYEYQEWVPVDTS